MVGGRSAQEDGGDRSVATLLDARSTGSETCSWVISQPPAERLKLEVMRTQSSTWWPPVRVPPARPGPSGVPRPSAGTGYAQARSQPRQPDGNALVHEVIAQCGCNLGPVDAGVTKEYVVLAGIQTAEPTSNILENL